MNAARRVGGRSRKELSSSALLAELRKRADPKRLEGMARFAIGGKNTLGVSMPEIRAVARKAKRNHTIAKELWGSGVHEARILASLLAEPSSMKPAEMDKWVKDFDSWDVCDQTCMNLFCLTPHAFAKAMDWCARKGEFERRAGFALMACLAVHAINEPDESFLPFFDAIKSEATDDRNFVKKAVNWALRQIGKRNKNLNKAAVRSAREIAKLDSRSARWIASDALRELTGDAVQQKIRGK
ncbi:MAG: DNA alkylation repair protein [Ignavibacteriae bacterium]|nr:DNA alkylation repair protein [Ignavibacteriota bacterium]